MMVMSQAEEFQLANRAFDIMTLAERELVLTEFAKLQYASIVDRFMDAVHTVIVSRLLLPPCSCTDSTPEGKVCRACGGSVVEAKTA